MARMDVLAKRLRGPFRTTRTGMVTEARIFTHDGRLFVAEGTQRGRTVTRVTEYATPEGEPVGNRWGTWSWTTCGCGSNWTTHSVESLVAMADPLDAEPDNPAPEIANPQVSADVALDAEQDIPDAEAV